MFSKKQLGILDWLLFYVFMIIPIVNIIIIIMLLISPATNKTLRSYIWLNIVFILIGVFFFATMFAAIIGALSNLAP